VTLDLVVLGIVLFAALFGAWKGFSRQIATAVGAVAAFFVASPLGTLGGPGVAKHIGCGLTSGVVIATVGAFLLVYLVVQVVTTMVLRRVLAGKDPNNTTTDRVLGFALGGGKLLAMTFVVLSGATFLESNITFAGKKVVFTPKDSVFVKLARDYNAFEHWQFSGVKDLVKVAKLVGNPQNAERLKDDPDLVSLTRDPRFKKALNADGMRRALESGDVHQLLGSGSVIELIQDPEMSRRLERLSERTPQ
jgi:uncharacterized membrane protein required for colicin V production